mmetsp:Transcript_8047/g.24870  ORF Transcript_8047/g.24870 Transcript_8047/m.24870 type:complete len:234 (-) Transcript_8047:389-1090(-)
MRREDVLVGIAAVDALHIAMASSFGAGEEPTSRGRLCRTPGDGTVVVVLVVFDADNDDVASRERGVVAWKATSLRAWSRSKERRRRRSARASMARWTRSRRATWSASKPSHVRTPSALFGRRKESQFLTSAAACFARRDRKSHRRAPCARHVVATETARAVRRRSTSRTRHRATSTNGALPAHQRTGRDRTRASTRRCISLRGCCSAVAFEARTRELARTQRTQKSAYPGQVS